MNVYILNSFDEHSCFLTESELKKLYKKFDHSTTEQLYVFFVKFEHVKGLNKAILNKLTKYCNHCQRHDKLSEKFKFILKNDIDFNYSIVVDIIFIDNASIFYIVDKLIKFQAIKSLSNMTARYV